MTTPPPTLCDASYSRRLAGKKFVCSLPPHPAKPDAHCYVASDDPVLESRISRLAIIPGERR